MKDTTPVEQSSRDEVEVLFTKTIKLARARDAKAAGDSSRELMRHNAVRGMRCATYDWGAGGEGEAPRMD